MSGDVIAERRGDHVVLLQLGQRLVEIVRKIIERHNGRVWIESTPGEGTTVFFTLKGE